MNPAAITLTSAVLLLSTLTDLKHRRGIKDKYYWITLALIPGTFLILQSPGTAGASLAQAIMGLAAGLAMRIFTKFGGADIYILSIISANFPGTLLIKTLAYVFIPYIIWLKLYSIRGHDTAPAIPGLFAGFILAVLIL